MKAFLFSEMKSSFTGIVTAALLKAAFADVKRTLVSMALIFNGVQHLDYQLHHQNYSPPPRRAKKSL
jgi:hypothetical protein